ncbi:substrate-binding periplasmic protein [Stutzerimonas zhaodongensis]|uniref:substrate-binding periplasmic protein n=1 Tax=Stutzerimonas TaxID=2901164 RepID=UPI0038906341
MKRQWSGCLLLSLALSLAAHAAEVRLVTGDDHEPLTGQSLEGGGMLSRVVQAAFSHSELASSLDWQPWNRGYLMTLRGEYDATFPYVRADERERDFLYSAPVYLSEQHLFSRAGDAVELEELSSSHGRRLCYPLGWRLPDGVQALVEQGVLSRHSPPGLNECAQLLLLGRDDFFLADLKLGRFVLDATDAPPMSFHISDSFLGPESMHLIVPRARPGAEVLIRQFDSGLAALRASGDYQRLVDGAWAGSAPAATH